MQKRKVTIDRYEADEHIGLTSEQVNERRKAHLNNPNKSKSGVSYLGIVVSELFTYFNILYMLITAVLIYLGHANQLTYLFVIIPNLIIGIWQKCRSKYNIDKLSLMAKTKVKVIRDAKEEYVDAEDVVRDDIIFFKSGSQISSDSLLISGECEVNESMLTGESLPVKKRSGDRLYAGSFVTSGTCSARVFDVGQDNYINKLASKAKKYKKPKSEILRALNGIIKVIGILIIPLAILLYLRTENVVKVAGAMIGIIPSGMFLLTSTALAVSMMRLSKQNTLVQEMYCIEMLARVDTICMDKTGTITDGTMTVQNAYAFSKEVGDDNVKTLIACMQSTVRDNNVTSLAINEYFGISNGKSVLESLAFSSDRKYYAVRFDDGAYALGAPEFVCDIEKFDFVKKEVEEQTKLGNRVLVLAKLEKDDEPLDAYNKENAIPIGAVVLEDHVRQDAIETINYFNQNGVALKVISGDNPLTVSEVARRAGIHGAEKYISLQDMSVEEVEKIANDYTVFGRVSPQQKEAIIRAIKAQNHTVSMIGDGVNDILALRECDCSIAIGSGTEAAKNVSHLILVDDNFANMKQVIAEGRRCTNNLQSTGSMFLTKTFICLSLCVFSLISAFSYPFSPNQLLLLEFFAIGLPGVFFALQPNKNIIKGKFLDNVLSKAFSQGLCALILVLPLYFLLLSPNFTEHNIQTMLTLVVTYNSLFVLFRVNKNLNSFRLAVALTMFILTTLAFLFCTDIIGLNVLASTPLINLFTFDFSSLNFYPQLVIVICLIALILPLQIGLFKLTEYVLEKIRQKRKINNK